MKKTDIGVVGFMYAVCAFFFLMSRDLKKGARIYPLCIIAILFLLTTGYVVEMLFAAKKNGVTSGIPEIFEGFQPKQFFIVLGMLIAYLICMYFVGFYLATIEPINIQRHNTERAECKLVTSLGIAFHSTFLASSKFSPFRL